MISSSVELDSWKADLLLVEREHVVEWGAGKLRKVVY